MTREEQIKRGAYESGYHNNNAYGRDCFIEGANWADEHPESPWISVEERLPEADFNCIVTNKIAGGTSVAYYLKDNKTWFAAYTGNEIHGITHWFPKPKFDE